MNSRLQTILVSSGVSVLLGIVLMSCGSGDGDAPASFPQQTGSALYSLHDSVRVRVTARTKNGVNRIFESVSRVGEISADLSEYRIDEFRIVRAKSEFVKSRTASAEELRELYFTSQEHLRIRCAELGGRMLNITLVTGAVQACRVVSIWSESGVRGRGEHWLGLVPFGVLKRSWSSDDGVQKITHETLSYVHNGVHQTLSIR